ncbi:MAG TPA: polysaccharide biosynthesis/export family protein [Candidatus Acidoferrum sp.]|nr:polysaccharide biosynthesis/export family protein [Candidatus Acidoferrum sp.]
MILTAFLFIATAPAKAQDPAAQEKKEEPKDSKTQTTTTPGQPPAADSTYKIGAQDVLKIDVWREDQLTRTVPVRPDGKISLPLLNDVQAVGLTPMELGNIIRDELKKYITNPQVTVSIAEINSRRVYVTGEVTHPGAFALLPNMTVLQALTSAGGFTQFAKIKSIYVLRMEGGKQVKHSFNYKDVLNGKKHEDNIQLEPGDTIIVP